MLTSLWSHRQEEDVSFSPVEEHYLYVEFVFWYSLTSIRSYQTGQTDCGLFKSALVASILTNVASTKSQNMYLPQQIATVAGLYICTLRDVMFMSFHHNKSLLFLATF